MEKKKERDSPSESPGLDPIRFSGVLSKDVTRHNSFDIDEDVPHVSRELVDPSIPARTKLICTLGSASNSYDIIKKFMEEGMNVARLDLSWGVKKDHEELIHVVRDVMSDTRRIVALMLDLKGPDIRIGNSADGKDIPLEKGQKFLLTTDSKVLNDKNKCYVDCKDLLKLVKKNSVVLIDDGQLSLTVISTNEKDGTVECLINNTGSLPPNAGVHLPGVKLDLPSLTEQDIKDIHFGMDYDVDFIAVLANSARDVLAVRELLQTKKSGIKIIAKVENRMGLESFEEILKVCDGIMVARGDLGVEIPIEQVSLAQKMAIRKCNAAGKFVITATQMLDSMIKNPSPTRAEASDVANAVLDGTDCVMLTGETAKGLWPVEAVRMMADICREAESSMNHRSNFQMVREFSKSSGSKLSVAEAIASSAVKAAFDLQASLVLVLTESGNTARLVSKYRPNAPILAITASEQSARQCLVSRGLFPLLVGSMSGTASLIHRAIMAAEKIGLCKLNDLVIITSGQHEGVSNQTNDLKVIQVTY